MSNHDRRPDTVLLGGRSRAAAGAGTLAPREVPLGGPRGVVVRRTLPHRDVRTVGPWCFVDHYGPVPLAEVGAMDLAPHPHTGLQTVSWLLSGSLLHRDSVGSVQVVAPGELNLMTAGRGIAHAETSAGSASPLHGVQLWVALPEAARHQEPHFEHHAHLPVLTDAGARVTVLVGEVAGAVSPAATYAPTVGAEVLLPADGGAVDIPVDPDFEVAVLAADGAVEVDGVPLPDGALRDLGTGAASVRLRAGSASGTARALLLGGAPFEEQLVMWWNFVGRSHDEIVGFRDDWAAGRRFREVGSYAGQRLPAPPLPGAQLRPRPSGRVAR